MYLGILGALGPVVLLILLDVVLLPPEDECPSDAVLDSDIALVLEDSDPFVHRLLVYLRDLAKVVERDPLLLCYSPYQAVNICANERFIYCDFIPWQNLTSTR